MPYIVFPSEVLDFAQDELGRACFLDFMHLYSLMCYPHDDAAQERFADALVAGETLALIDAAKREYGDDLKLHADAALMLSVASAPNLHESIREAAANAAFGGTVSGMILGWIIFRGQRPDTRSTASLGAAFRMIEEACKQGRWRGGKVENLKRHIWPTYRSVAHLWAALHVWDNQAERPPLAPDELHHFLMTAEWFRRNGEAYHVDRSRAGAAVLDADETWTIRPDVSAEWPSFDLQCRDLDAWDLRKQIKRRD
jgi:hypothetical protein